MLSAITLWHRHSHLQPKALRLARMIFAEEDLRYSVDDDGGVHFLVDEEFTRNIESTLAGLGQKRFSASKAALDGALESLGPTQQSGKALIRGVFESVESAFLVIVGPGNANRLNKQTVNQFLKPILRTQYASVPEGNDKVDRLLDTFLAWVNSAHPYRHGTAASKPMKPQSMKLF